MTDTTQRNDAWNGGQGSNHSLRHHQRSLVYGVVRDNPWLTADEFHPLVDEQTKERGVTRIKSGRVLRLLEDLERRGEIRAAPRAIKWKQWSIVPPADRHEADPR